jgi:hypothetical protein
MSTALHSMWSGDLSIIEEPNCDWSVGNRNIKAARDLVRTAVAQCSLLKGYSKSVSSCCYTEVLFMNERGGKDNEFA